MSYPCVDCSKYPKVVEMKLTTVSFTPVIRMNAYTYTTKPY